MRILLTNDDGIFAKGIQVLARELEKYHEVIIVAPNTQRSASSHSITISTPLIIKEEKIEGIKSKAFSVSGTPADCTRVGLMKLVEDKVDLVISGTNEGYNLGTDVIYSGTVSAAIEAAILKVPSVAISCDGKDKSYNLAAKIAIDIAEKAKEFKNDIVLNVNIPHIDENIKNEIKVCRIGERNYKNIFIEKLNEDGTRSIKIKGALEDSDTEETDVYNIKRGYTTITPLHYDLTNFNILEDVKKMF
ncbi:MAG: 5'/3'-nucleotidase SurE [Clostridium argentinense]|uniref:5'-nucleotidase SurE n=1 Tax=Clostridium faecium TaxID=2762223 RepID=A0ABR8YUG8_9CLOT|nr:MULTISPECIES: 5'/3'-nucleotidase SurE [Clostridium]MBD8047923.1 5'/3'-nucleotidase SurE [Clostridium faecium]MBS5825246.1 5'/3'-nucleotidase SurE [Clostridium argentinense]MDU1350981.1 5'/3'-nucleotidase SurE [Clostridium argentinense]